MHPSPSAAKDTRRTDLETNEMGPFEKWIARISHVLIYFSAGFLLAMLFLGTADIIGRYLFRKPVVGTVEIFEVLLPAIVLLGLAYTQQKKAHIAIDLFYSHLPPKPRAILGFATTCWAVVLFGLMGWQGILQSTLHRQTGSVITNIGVPLFLTRLFVPIGAFAILLVLIVDLRHLLTQIRKGN